MRGFKLWVMRLIAPLAGRVAALEDDHNPEALQADPFLQLD